MVQWGQRGAGVQTTARCRAATQAQLAARNDPPVPNWFDAIIGADKPRMRAVPMKVEPKTFFANERTFLHWLHMAVTIGSISAALLGFAATSDRCDPHSQSVPPNPPTIARACQPHTGVYHTRYGK